MMNATALTLFMSLLEDQTASFIVRIWRERGEGPGEKPWRGSIEHAQSGSKSFFRDLPSLMSLIRPHLAALGISDEPATDRQASSEAGTSNDSVPHTKPPASGTH